MTEHLSTVIKPASPRPDTQALIEGNAKNGSFTTMLILRDHYTDEMEAQIIKLNTLSTYHWQNPLDVASSWAKRNLGRRLQDETLEQTAALLTSQIVDRTVATPAQPEQSVRPTAVCPSPNTSVAQIHAPPAQIGPPSQTPAPHTSPTKTVNTTTTVTDPKRDCPPIVEVETEYLIPPSIVLTSPAPKPQRTRRLPSLTPRGKRVPSLTPQPPAHSPPPPFNLCVVTEEDSILDLSLEELEDALVPATLPQQPSCPVLSRSPVATRSLSAAVQSQLQMNTVRQSQPTLPEPMTPTRRPKRHLNTVKKLQDWSLSVGKKWLIMGDSNLALLPPFTINELQIDSYPGATFRHAEAIIKKATSSTVVEKVDEKKKIQSLNGIIA
ncbi:Filamentous hemagglutinin [Dissostichus eleginoides]|uniref:Filamentous hemagglutinin n=1 Tax=Dissostichus eleginoides TaxID=100907 RepID=A0AAD9C0F5_DISEL|nr:Filamentous hemagglutinin [Dissostichus eleginoides]